MAIKNIIFDLGRVLINWDIKGFAKSYTGDLDKQIKISKIFSLEPWMKLDKGTISEENLEIEYSEILNIPIEEIREIIKEARKIMTVKEETVTELYKLAKKYKIFCISNMSHKSWEIVKQNSFVSAFDDIIISAQVKNIKPEIEIYQKAVKKFNIIPKESIFIDDLKENIIAAEQLGITGILFDESRDCWDKIKKLT